MIAIDRLDGRPGQHFGYHLLGTRDIGERFEIGLALDGVVESTRTPSKSKTTHVRGSERRTI